MEIKILGPGCARCKATSEALEKVIQSRGIQAQLTKVEDMREIVSYGVLSTPGVVIDGKVVHTGSVPTREMIEGWLAAKH